MRRNAGRSMRSSAVSGDSMRNDDILEAAGHRRAPGRPRRARQIGRACGVRASDRVSALAWCPKRRDASVAAIVTASDRRGTSAATTVAGPATLSDAIGWPV